MYIQQLYFYSRTVVQLLGNIFLDRIQDFPYIKWGTVPELQIREDR